MIETIEVILELIRNQSPVLIAVNEFVSNYASLMKEIPEDEFQKIENMLLPLYKK